MTTGLPRAGPLDEGAPGWPRHRRARRRRRAGPRARRGRRGAGQLGRHEGRVAAARPLGVQPPAAAAKPAGVEAAARGRARGVTRRRPAQQHLEPRRCGGPAWRAASARAAEDLVRGRADESEGGGGEQGALRGRSSPTCRWRPRARRATSVQQLQQLRQIRRLRRLGRRSGLRLGDGLEGVAAGQGLLEVAEDREDRRSRAGRPGAAVRSCADGTWRSARFSLLERSRAG